MALPNYLAQIKSSGIYRFVWDKSEITGTPAQTLRLVVGYSEKGPFNTPVYITSATEFKNVYGDINKKLEKRGIFFHRLALQCLEKTPILALNLKKFSDEKVKATSFNVSDETIDLSSIDVESIYDTTRFWKLDPEQILNATEKVNPQVDKNKQYISIASTDSKETSCSVFIRGYKPNGYDVTISSWYGSQGEDVPEYFTTEESDYSSALVSDFWAEMFVFRGEFTPQICATAPLNKYFNVNKEEGTDKITVSLKPFIVNAFGEKIDTLTALANDESSNFINTYTGCLLPYFKNQMGAYASLDLAFNADNGTHKMMMNLNSDYLFNEEISIDKLITTGWTGNSVFGIDLTDKESLTQTCTIEEGIVKYSNYEGFGEPVFITYNLLENYPTSEQVKDKTLNGETIECTKYEGADSADCIYLYEGKLYKDSNTTDELEEIVSFNTLGLTIGNRVKYNDDVYTISKLTDSNLTVVDYSGNEQTIEISSIFTLCNRSAAITNNLTPLYFEGYTYGNAKPESGSDIDKLNWQQFILSTLVEYTGIRTALTNRVDIDYRYIVDTFEAFVDTEVHKEIALIAKEKDNAIALLNFPSMKVFKNCQYTSFTDDNNKLQVKYIAEGGNKKKNPGKLFTLVSETNGASYVSYNTPLVFSDGTLKTIVPSAALVSNNFIDKYETRQPYYIVAGPNYGRIIATGLVGPEYNFTRADLDIFEPMGVNAMIYVPRIGTYINSNQTAKQNPVTALSKLNVRELVIYLQDSIEALLQDYQWEFNTQYLRDLVKAKADTICDRIKNNGGIYNYLNVCDESNNTDDVINNEMFVLSTSIEPGMGCGKMVHELTIYKKGQMSSIIK